MKHMESAQQIFKMAKTIGFDRIEVRVRDEQELCVRVANSAVCRENVLRDDQKIHITACLEGRSGHLELPGSMKDRMQSKLEALLTQLKAQPIDKEFVMPRSQPGSYNYDLTTCDFLEAYGPDSLYPALEEALQPIRKTDMRSTGYVEAKEGRTAIITSDDTEISIHDHGITSGFTVDHPETMGASGSSQESGVQMNRSRVGDLVAGTVDQARQIAELNQTTGPCDAGDYTVVLHPRAVADILRTMLMYRMLDRRRIDEGQTYLSAAKDGLKFPRGLSLTQSPKLQYGDVTYEELAINANVATCEPMHLIKGGRIQDLHTGAFWAKKHGVEETFAPYFSPPVTLQAATDDDLQMYDDLEAMIAGTEKGIYVANTWYLRMVSNMEGTITGMTRDGVFEIENGKITRPLNNMRWHENPFRVFSHANAAGRQLHLLGLSRWAGQARGGLCAVPAMRIPDFHFSSQTKF